MAPPIVHLRHQGPVLATLGRTALAALTQKLPFRGHSHAPAAGELHATLPARDPDLVRDYLRHVGGDSATYPGVLPPHLFPHWAMPLAAKTLEGVPYPIAKVLNGGSRIEVNRPLPAGEPLLLRAQLESIDDDGRRALLHQRLVTGTASAPDALVSHIYAVVPLRRIKSEDRPKDDGKRPHTVPTSARELTRWRLPSGAGLTFAMLTGDFNPVHWIRPYARAFGFRSTILHGFSTMARAWEGVVREVLSGDASRIRVFDVKFTRPLVLPAQVGLYLDGDAVYVGDAPGKPAYLVGAMELVSKQEAVS